MKNTKITTAIGHRFGMFVESITTGIQGTVVGITQCIAGCEILEIKVKNDKGAMKSNYLSSKLVKIINSDKVAEYEKLFAQTSHDMPFRLGDVVTDTVSEVTGTIGEIQYSVNTDPGVLLIKKWSEDDVEVYETARVMSCTSTGQSIHDQLLENRKKRERGELKVETLQRARCMATGVTGLITSVFNQASGTISVGIQPKGAQGKLLESHFTDIELVEVLEEKTKENVQTKKARKKPSGCVRSHELSCMKRKGMRAV
ncbi:hypothetical protein NVP1081O_165 [Vibrio phage 1.081.O._10N.286.52.C2]|nr:hypothetical protein NVP1081O_165 [Vibrio phage 1.081.O._10N.286.52.C2]